jgi:hypothetical protein
MTNKNIYIALLKAQKQITYAVKDALNPHFKNNYATLESVIDAVKAPLNDNGIFITHELVENILTTKLIHAETSEFVSSSIPLILSRNDMQQLGSAITYAKRYNLTSLCNLPTEDDDGNAASLPNAYKEKLKTTQNAVPKPSSVAGLTVENFVVKFGPDDIKNKTFKEIGAKRLSEHCRSIVDQHEAQGKEITKATQSFLDAARSYIVQCSKG